MATFGWFDTYLQKFENNWIRIGVMVKKGMNNIKIAENWNLNRKKILDSAIELFLRISGTVLMVFCSEPLPDFKTSSPLQ